MLKHQLRNAIIRVLGLYFILQAKEKEALLVNVILKKWAGG